jgi:hypothetical protein
MEYLCDALESNVNLFFLGLAYNRITARSCLTLAAALESNQTLRSVQLDGNPLGKLGIRAILLPVARGDEPRDISFDGCNSDIINHLGVSSSSNGHEGVEKVVGQVPDGKGGFTERKAWVAETFNETEPNGRYELNLAQPYDRMAVGRKLLELAKQELLEDDAGGGGGGDKKPSSKPALAWAEVSYSEDGTVNGKPGKLPPTKVEELLRGPDGLDALEKPKQGLLCIEFKAKPKHGGYVGAGSNWQKLGVVGTAGLPADSSSAGKGGGEVATLQVVAEEAAEQEKSAQRQKRQQSVVLTSGNHAKLLGAQEQGHHKDAVAHRKEGDQAATHVIHEQQTDVALQQTSLKNFRRILTKQGSSRGGNQMNQAKILAIMSQANDSFGGLQTPLLRAFKSSNRQVASEVRDMIGGFTGSAKINATVEMYLEQDDSHDTERLFKGLLVAEVEAVIQQLGPAYAFNSHNPTGHYALELSNKIQRQLARRLIRVEKQERMDQAREQQVDVSQHGNWSRIRNERHAGRPFVFSDQWGAGLPKTGAWEFDYVSTVRPRFDCEVISQREFRGNQKRVSAASLWGSSATKGANGGAGVVDAGAAGAVITPPSSFWARYVDVRPAVALLMRRALENCRIISASQQQARQKASVEMSAITEEPGSRQEDMLAAETREIAARQALLAAETTVPDDEFSEMEGSRPAAEQDFPVRLDKILAVPRERPAPSKVATSASAGGSLLSAGASAGASAAEADDLAWAKAWDEPWGEAASMVLALPTLTPAQAAQLEADGKQKLLSSDVNAVLKRESTLTLRQFEQIYKPLLTKVMKSKWPARLSKVLSRFYFTAAHAAELVGAMETSDDKVRIYTQLYARIVDEENMHLLSSRLSREEKQRVNHQLGALSTFNPMYPDGPYRLDLSHNDDRLVAICLAQLEVAEPGDNWIGETYDGKPFGVTITWVKDPPKTGILQLQYETQSGCAAPEVRQQIAEDVLGWEF